MKQALNLRQTQRLVMTPQLQQSIRLLQMSTTELRQEALSAQETNPVLEIDDGSRDSELVADISSQESINSTENENSSLSSKESVQPDLSFEDHYNSEQNNSGVDERSPEQWNEVRPSSTNSTLSNLPEYQEWHTADLPLTLKQSLRQQLDEFTLSFEQSLIASHIVDYLDDRGYLEIPLAEIGSLVSEEIQTSDDEIEATLKVVQSLDPPGIAARSPQECLLLQLDYRETSTARDRDARLIVERCLDDLARNDHSKIRRRTGLSNDSILKAVHEIQQLNPHPGFAFDSQRVEYVVPDVLVKKREKFWYADLNVTALPKLMVNPDYQRLIESQPQNDEYKNMRQQLADARNLVSNFDKRYKTILAVAKEIVERQQDYFHYGAERLKPMVLRDIADALSVHESTVSRATAGKFMLTPNGTVELKYFFSRQLNTKEGDSASSVAVQSIIRQLINQESPEKPISDNALCQLLEARGIEIARRTVAKYREQMKIPSSGKRRVRA
ncbi:MAG: RNA polymerase factor sigma-54 [Pseudomonadota bacterium]